MESVQVPENPKKRKARNQDNDRLSKRLSLLNLERNGQKLYVPVEQPTLNTTPTTSKGPPQSQDEDAMQLDDKKHKVYIYNIEDELSDSDASDDGKLAFLPDIQKHLRDSRIPPAVLANGEGNANNQLVLYRVPSSLTVPEEQDSVRKAIIETRARAHAKQEEKREGDVPKSQNLGFGDGLNVVEATTSNISNGISNGDDTMEVVEDDPDAMDLG